MNGTERERPTGRSAHGLSSIADITGDLLRNTINLVSDEVRMGTAEISERISIAGKNSTLITAGALVAYAGLLFLLVAAFFGLSILVPPAWAALIVGAVALIAGGILVIVGKKRLSPNVMPRETIDTAKEDTKWMRNRLT